MDDSVRLNLSEEPLHSREIGNVAIVVGDCAACVTVRIGAQVEDRNLSLGMALDDVAHNVATQESASADDDHRTKGLKL
jgi:hypothetical protein